ncbi:NADH:quinone oxidoreductase subunit M [Gammaproteobacteria bacterium]
MMLPWLVLIPWIGGLLCWQMGARSPHLPRWIAMISMAVVLMLVLLLWVEGDYSLSSLSSTPVWQQEFRAPWIESFGVSFHLGVDGLSVSMLLLAAGLGLASVVCSWTEVQHNPGVFYLNLLWNLGATFGVFLALDLFLFFCFWEMMLVPIFFLIALWGYNPPQGKGRIYAANQFFIFAQTSGLLLLFSIIGLVLAHYFETSVLSFDYEVLRTTKLTTLAEWILMLGFFIPFAVKLPIFPLHAWLPDAHAHAPTAGSVDIAGILIKTGAYALLRFTLPLFPRASQAFAPIAMTLGLIGIYYGAILACAQEDIKRLVAYINISSMGFVLIALYSANTMALQGAVLQMLAHALSSGALFILFGQLFERLRTRDLREMGGLWSRLSFLPGAALFFAMASLSLPGTGNFVSEFLILLGVYKTAPIVAALAAGSLVLAVVYSLRMVQTAFFGPLHEQCPEILVEPNSRERVLVGTFVVLLLALGLYPQPLLDLSRAPLALIYHMQVSATAVSVPVP